MFDDLLTANRLYAQTFDLGDLAPTAARRLAVVACIDSRIEPLSVLGLAPGDAKILRNAGGRVTDDVLRSLSIAVALLNVERIVVLHHTGCALAGKSDSDLRAAMAGAAVGEAAGAAVGEMWLGAMPDPPAALAADVAAVRSAPAIPASVEVAGWVYDVRTGLIAAVIGP